MRTIKFRQWHPGYKDKVKPHMEEPIDWLPSERFGEWMQFTGLLDKNGKEIYEFDHILCDGRTFEVRWNDEEASFDFNLISKNWSPKMSCNPKESEIVGNKYEN